MRHRVLGKKLGRDIKERKALFKNLIISLISHGEMKTTEAKAKAVRGLVDKLVTKAKQGTLHARRQVLAFLSRRGAVEKLFDEIVPAFKKRQSGFTRIIKIGSRRGDNAPMVMVEWCDEVQDSIGSSSSRRPRSPFGGLWRHTAEVGGRKEKLKKEATKGKEHESNKANKS